MDLQKILIIALVLILPLLLLWGAVKGVRWYMEKTRVFPLRDEVATEAGHRTHILLRQAELDLQIFVATLPLVLLLFYVVWLLSQMGQEIRLLPAQIWVLLYLLALLTQVGLVYRLMLQAGRLKLRLAAETIVGQQLNQLLRDGYRVYHDVQIGQYEVQHLVIGACGIFVVETLPQPKLMRKGESQFRFYHENGALIFPRRRNKKIMDESRRKAGALMVLLTKALGQPIKVSPLLVVPGWYLEVKEKPAFAILTPKQVPTFFAKLVKVQFEDYQLEKIVMQIEQTASRNGQDRRMEKTL